jgi:hypothetical protein
MKVVGVRAAAALAIVGLLGVGAPAVASAKGAATIAPTTFKAVSPMKAYDKALNAYKASRVAIRDAYQSAVDEAQSAYQASLSVARNSSRRSIVRATLRLAITEATAAREAALLALGKPPVKP